MPYITTHPGAPFYEWYVNVYGYAPPSQVNTQAARYLAWQEGVPKALAATIPFGSIGPPGLFEAGSALIAPVTVTTPTSPAPVQAPAATVLESGVTPVASTPAPVTPAPVATVASASALPTYYGIPYDQARIAIVRDVLNIGQSYHASRVVLEAAVYAMMGESDIAVLTGNGGAFQTTCDMSAYSDGSDYKAQAVSFYNGGTCFARGAISYSHEYNTAWQIANATEENAIWARSRGDSYARGGYSTAQLSAEASYAVSYFLPGLGSSPATPSAPTGGSNAPIQSEAQLTSTIEKLNWAGDFENLFKNIQGGSNEASNMAKLFNENTIDRTTYVPWH